LTPKTPSANQTATGWGAGLSRRVSNLTKLW
jgi:hypothetical protein